MTSDTSASAANAREILGPVRQLGYVVHDIEEAMRDWTSRHGVEGWRFRMGIVFDRCTYMGTPIDVDVDIASAYSGGMEIELIAQSSTDPSMYSEHLKNSGPGAQHICFFPPDYEVALQHLLDTGLDVLLEGNLGGTDFAYLGDGRGQVVEIAKLSAASLAERDERRAASLAQCT